MGAARTIRQGNLGKRALRLAEKDGEFYGLADGRVCVEGTDADRVWKKLHDEAGKSGPKFFGYSGAGIRFLTFFPNGFHSEGYAAQERDYKLDAKNKLDATAPLEMAITGSGYGEAILSVFFVRQTCFHRLRRRGCRTCFEAQVPLPSFGRPRNLPRMRTRIALADWKLPSSPMTAPSGCL